MANRNFNRKQALEKEVKDLYLKVTFGAAGAPTLTKGVGFVSIVRSNQGDYKVTLDDKYVELKYIEGIFLSSSGEDIRVQIKADAISSTKTFDFFTLTGATATDPASGTVLLLKVEVKNSSAL